MNSKDRRDDWTVIIAVALIAFGAWVLLRTTVGDILPIRQAIDMTGKLVLPLSLIAVGLLLYYTSRRGPIGSGGTGRRIYRSRTERMVGGVLGGLGDYLGIDPVWLRIATVLLVLLGAGVLIVLYIIAMVVIPEEPEAGAASPVWPTAGPSWPDAGAPTPPPASSGWPHTGEAPTPPPPAPPEPPSAPGTGTDER